MTFGVLGLFRLMTFIGFLVPLQVQCVISAHAQTFPEKPVSLGFSVVGGDAGIPLSAMLDHLIHEDAVNFLPVPVQNEDLGMTSILQRYYGVDKWVELDGFVNSLCEVNPQVCTRLNGKAVWHISSTGKDIPFDACKTPTRQKQPLSANFVCLPNMRIVSTKTLLTRRFSEGEGEQLPQVITQFTRGCEVFDLSCQITVLKLNPRQTGAWAKGASLLESGDTSLNLKSKSGWWSLLSGTVTLPATTLTVSLPAEQKAEKLDALCSNIERATTEAHATVRQERSYLTQNDNGDTRTVKTRCREVLRIIRAGGDHPQSALISRVYLSEDALKPFQSAWLNTMNWTQKTVHSTSPILIGLWDGQVNDGLGEFIRNDVTPLAPEQGAGNNMSGMKFLSRSGVAIDDPAPNNNSRLNGPCGDFVIPEPGSTIDPLTDHATMIAAMLIGKFGLIPNALIWAHEWDPLRLTVSNPLQRYNLLQKYVPRLQDLSPSLMVPIIANLSCAPKLDLRGQDGGKGAQDVREAFLRETANQHPDVLDVAAGVAAGNREDTHYPDTATPEVDDHGNPGAQGYARLARNYSTSGFISVVALGPTGADVLRCGDIKRLLSSIAGVNAQQPDGRVSDDCDEKAQTDQNDDDVDPPLGVFGPAYDVGAVGLGWGRTSDSDLPQLRWGSSFAAPYVTALIADIYSETRARRILYNRASAKLVADRIRFTADSAGDSSKFGRINAGRAFHFWDDQVELHPSDPPSAAEQANCLAFELSRRPQDKRYLTVLDGRGQETHESIDISTILRLRRTPSADEAGAPPIYQAFVRENDSLLDVKAVSSNLQIPILCLPEKKYFSIEIQDVDSITPCSFKSGCRQ